MDNAARSISREVTEKPCSVERTGKPSRRDVVEPTATILIAIYRELPCIC